MLEQTVVHLIRQHVDATTFSASLIHTPTMQELASVRRFLDGLCSGSNDDSDPAARLLRLIRRVDISPGSVSILLDRNTFAACLSMGPERIREDALRILAPFRLRRRGVETKLVLGNPTKSVDRTLLRNIANALSWLDRIKAGKTYEQIAIEHAIPTDRVRKAIRYAFLAPDIVRAIVEGRQPVGLTSSYLLHHPLPTIGRNSECSSQRCEPPAPTSWMGSVSSKLLSDTLHQSASTWPKFPVMVSRLG